MTADMAGTGEGQEWGVVVVPWAVKAEPAAEVTAGRPLADVRPDALRPARGLTIKHSPLRWETLRTPSALLPSGGTRERESPPTAGGVDALSPDVPGSARSPGKCWTSELSLSTVPPGSFAL